MPQERVWLEGDADEIVTHHTEKLTIQYSGICPHFGGPVTYLEKEKCFKCPWHDWEFNLEGKCTNRNTGCRVRVIYVNQH